MQRRLLALGTGRYHRLTNPLSPHTYLFARSQPRRKLPVQPLFFTSANRFGGVRPRRLTGRERTNAFLQTASARRYVPDTPDIFGARQRGNPIRKAEIARGGDERRGSIQDGPPRERERERRVVIGHCLVTSQRVSTDSGSQGGIRPVGPARTPYVELTLGR